MSPPPGSGPEPYAGQPFYPPPPGQPYSPNAGYDAQQAQAGAQIHPAYGYDGPQQGYVPPDPGAYAPPSGAAPYQAGNNGPRRADENVSADRSIPDNPAIDNANINNVPLYDSNGVPFYTSSGEGALPV